MYGEHRSSSEDEVEDLDVDGADSEGGKDIHFFTTVHYESEIYKPQIFDL